METYTQKQFKSILNVRKYIDGWFWDKYTLSGYNGCQFGCIYCDSRSAKYNMPTDFENNIIVKTNVGEMLDKRISNARKLLPDVVAMSGGCDPFQPAEKQFGNTENCLKILLKHKYPVHILTKSILILNYLNLLEEIAKETWCTISLTITTTNEKISRFIESRVPSPSKRLDVITKIKKDHPAIQTGVLLMPVVPFLTDSKEDIELLVKATKDAGADYILFSGGMTLRDMQATWFLKHLKDKYPQLIPHYEKLYHFTCHPNVYSGSYGTTSEYYNRINRLIFNACVKYNMPFLIKRFIPKDYREINYMIAEKLLAESYMKHIEGNRDNNLYWAAMNIQNLKESINEFAEKNDLQSIRNIDSHMEQRIKNELTLMPKAKIEAKQTKFDF